MENELTTHQTGALVEALDQQGLGEMIKPLIREIHLFDSFVAGTTHLEDKTVLNEIAVGNKLSLIRDTISLMITRLWSSRRPKRNWDMYRRRIIWSLRGLWMPGSSSSLRSRRSKSEDPSIRSV